MEQKKVAYYTHTYDCYGQKCDQRLYFEEETAMNALKELVRYADRSTRACMYKCVEGEEWIKVHELYGVLKHSPSHR